MRVCWLAPSCPRPGPLLERPPCAWPARSCQGGCACSNVTVDAFHTTQVSVINLAEVQPSGSMHACEVVVTVLNATSTQGHKFKVSGVSSSRVGR